MSFKKRVGTTIAALALALTGAVATSSPAQAGFPSDCFSGKFCMWDDATYNGALYMYSASTSCTNLVSQNNRASSLNNRTSRSVRIYDGSNCSGSYYTISSNYALGNMTCLYQCANWNDRVSSFKQV